MYRRELLSCATNHWKVRKRSVLHLILKTKSQTKNPPYVWILPFFASFPPLALSNLSCWVCLVHFSRPFCDASQGRWTLGLRQSQAPIEGRAGWSRARSCGQIQMAGRERRTTRKQSSAASSPQCFISKHCRKRKRIRNSIHGGMITKPERTGGLWAKKGPTSPKIRSRWRTYASHLTSRMQRSSDGNATRWWLKRMSLKI